MPTRRPAPAAAPVPSAGRAAPFERVGLVALSLLVLGGAVAGYLVDAGARLWVANATWTGAALVAAIGVHTALRRSAPPARGGWALLLVGCVAWLLGQVVWDAYSATGIPASPNVADLAWLAFAVAGGLGVHRLGFGAARAGRVAWLELAPLMVGACALLTALLWTHIVASRLSGAAQLTSLAYPVLYVCAAVTMLQAVLAGLLDLRHNRGMAAVLAGLVLEAIAFIRWSPLLLAQGYVPGTHVIDALWTIGLLSIGLGAWRARPPAPIGDVAEVVHRRGGVLPSLTFAALSACQVAFAALDAPTDAELAVSIGVAVVGATLIARAAVLRRQEAGLTARLRLRERELRTVNGRLRAESRRDALTGLANRLRLSEDFVELAADAERYGRTYCVVLCDLDRFKDYNDRLGHQAGDAVLRRVAELLREQTRDGDRVYRYGGEELLLVLREQDASEGGAVAERHRAAVQAVAMAHPGNPPAGVVTFSAGVAGVHPGERPDDVLRRADRALYEAKAAGRNRVAVSQPPLTQPAAALSA